jgi:hypothetical protein
MKEGGREGEREKGLCIVFAPLPFNSRGEWKKWKSDIYVLLI